MSLWEAALLGVVQGLTEFLPISSTAHLLFVQQLLGRSPEQLMRDPFTIVVQLGTLVAVFVYFRTDVAKLGRGFLFDVYSLRIGATPEGWMAWLVILGTVPVVVAGLVGKEWLEDTFYNLRSIAVVAIVFALLLGVAEWWAHRRDRLGKPGRSEGDLGWPDALWIGTWQALALMPGGSRSGTTITGGLFAGLTRPLAARFSFVLSLPAITGAGVKVLYDEYKHYARSGGTEGLFASGDDMTALAVGLVVSGVVGYFVIAALLHFLKRYSTAVFIVYRLLFGTAILLALRIGAAL